LTSTAFIVMAKAPVPGLAKTRLAPALGAEGAAALAARLLEHALSAARAAAEPGDVLILACAPDTTHAAFQAAAARGPLRLLAQCEGDLGARMARAFETAFDAAFDAASARADRVLMLGTDAPALDAATLRRARRALAGADAVLVPAHDGGYALVGLARPAPMLFAPGMPWSTDRVMVLTRERLAAAGLCWSELDPVHDIDTPADLAHLPAGWM
jgi:rSAM/selenodomain-associated transferase 1